MASSFSYNASGTLVIDGCATMSLFWGVVVPYGIGSILYDCFAARTRGVVEAIAIKKYHTVLKANKIIVMYVDTYNTIWNERDLCLKQTAIDLAINYWESRMPALCP